jgi:hypothetical protein
MNGAIDFEGINAAALRSTRSLLPELIPGGKFRSLEYVVKNPCRDDRQPGSFCINCKSGRWKDFASGNGGADLISLVAYIRGVGQGDAAREVAEIERLAEGKRLGRRRSSQRDISYDGSAEGLFVGQQRATIARR